MSREVENDPFILVSAARQGDRRKVKRMLREGWDIEGCDSRGWRAIHGAADCGRVEVLRLLLRRKAKVNAITPGGETALMWAALRGHNDVIELLVEHEADVNFTDEEGRTALHGAALRGETLTVELLLNHDADVSIADWDGGIALHGAAYGSHTEIVRAILKKQADVFHSNTHGKKAAQCVGVWHNECDRCSDCKQTTKLLQLSESLCNQIVTGALHRCITKHPSSMYSYLEEQDVLSSSGQTISYAELLNKLTRDKFTVAGFAKKIGSRGLRVEAEIFREEYAIYIQDIYEAVTTSPDDLDVSEVDDRLVSKWKVPIDVPRPPPDLKDFDLTRFTGFFKRDHSEILLPLPDPTALTSYKRVDDANQVRQMPADMALPVPVLVVPPMVPATITGQPDERQLSFLAKDLGFEWFRLGIELGFRHSQTEQFQLAYPGQPYRWIMAMLTEWRAGVQDRAEEDRRKIIFRALEDIDRNDLAKEFN